MWDAAEPRIQRLQQQILELEYTLIPHGLHVVGEAMSAEARRETLASVAEAGSGADLARMDQLLSEDHEIAGLLRALDARFIRPVPGGDLIRSPEILPTGRNLHGFDPFRIPSAFALQDGARQAGAAARHPCGLGQAAAGDGGAGAVGHRQSEERGRARSRRRWRCWVPHRASTVSAGCAAQASFRWPNSAARAST